MTESDHTLLSENVRNESDPPPPPPSPEGPINHGDGDGEGMHVPCSLQLFGKKHMIEIFFKHQILT